MSDYYPAKITIGGRLRRSLFDALMEVLEAEELGLEWGETADPRTIREYIDKQVGQHPLIFMNCEARNGQFEDVERFCIDNGLAYRRHNSARGEADCEIVWHDPDEFSGRLEH